MNAVLRLFILASAIIVLFFVFRKLKKSEFEIADSIFWFLFVAMLTILACFPQIAYTFASLLGFAAAVNFVFFAVIGILIIRVFTLNAKVAHLRIKTNRLIQELALREKEHDE